MAGNQLARGSRDATLDTTALVHELYLRVNTNRELQFEHDAQFFAYAAQAMNWASCSNCNSRFVLTR
ncbi:MAG TPA: ECF-type sigma factor, partial [Dokdonella sp.]|nr:ECF-type sigma factor [Dokdonella sp.]